MPLAPAVKARRSRGGTTMADQVATMGTAGSAAGGKGMLWAGRIFTAVPVLMMAMSGVMKLVRPPQLVETFVGKFGYSQSALVPIGIVELLCVLLYAIPRTSVLGAILVTGYLGGATATHVRIADAWVAPVVLGAMAWGGLFLRDERLRRLLPLRRDA
jgi:hypothetical protein